MAWRALKVEQHDQGAVTEEAVGCAAIERTVSLKMVLSKQPVGSLLFYPCTLLSNPRSRCVLLYGGFSSTVNLE